MLKLYVLNFGWNDVVFFNLTSNISAFEMLILNILISKENALT